MEPDSFMGGDEVVAALVGTGAVVIDIVVVVVVAVAVGRMAVS